VSSSSVCGPVNGFFAGTAPEKLHHLGRAFGLLSSIQPGEDYQIARINDDFVVLPLNLDLSQYLGQSIGMMRDVNRILIRRLESSSCASQGGRDESEERHMMRCLTSSIDALEAGQ